MSEERGSEETRKITLQETWQQMIGFQAPQEIWEELMEFQEPASVDETFISLKVWGKIRGLLRVALAKKTKDDYKQGCLAVLALVDTIDPAGKRVYVTRETFAPENPAEAQRKHRGG